MASFPGVPHLQQQSSRSPQNLEALDPLRPVTMPASMRQAVMLVACIVASQVRPYTRLWRFALLRFMLHPACMCCNR